MTKQKSKSSEGGVALPSYKTANELLEDQGGNIFRALEDKSFSAVAYEYGLDRYMKTESSMRNAIYRVYNTVLENPSKYGIQPDKAVMIQKIVSARSFKKEPDTLRGERESGLDINRILLDSRDVAAKLVLKKLDYLDRHPKELKEMKLRDLAGVLATLFDKGQIAEGRATEHISVLSNINVNMSADEALQAIFGLRETIVSTKGKQSNQKE